MDRRFKRPIRLIFCFVCALFLCLLFCQQSIAEEGTEESAETEENYEDENEESTSSGENYETETSSSTAKIHEVWIWQESKDCLWNIAKKYYGDPTKWWIIYEANKDQISDPRVIYPKQRLLIPQLEEE